MHLSWLCPRETLPGIIIIRLSGQKTVTQETYKFVNCHAFQSILRIDENQVEIVQDVINEDEDFARSDASSPSFHHDQLDFPTDLNMTMGSEADENSLENTSFMSVDEDLDNNAEYTTRPNKLIKISLRNYDANLLSPELRGYNTDQGSNRDMSFDEPTPSQT